jgi:hypothetical protein
MSYPSGDEREHFQATVDLDLEHGVREVWSTVPWTRLTSSFSATSMEGRQSRTIMLAITSYFNQINRARRHCHHFYPVAGYGHGVLEVGRQ